MNSNDLKQLEVQRELELFRQPDLNAYPLEIIRKFATSGKAFSAACDSCGLPDKSIYEFCHIDSGTFSKIKSGSATLQAELVKKFCFAVNNRIYPEWCAFQLGCTLVEIKSESERRADTEKLRADTLQIKFNVLLEAMTGKASA